MLQRTGRPVSEQPASTRGCIACAGDRGRASGRPLACLQPDVVVGLWEPVEEAQRTRRALPLWDVRSRCCCRTCLQTLQGASHPTRGAAPAGSHRLLTRPASAHAPGGASDLPASGQGGERVRRGRRRRVPGKALRVCLDRSPRAVTDSGSGQSATPAERPGYPCDRPG